MNPRAAAREVIDRLRRFSDRTRQAATAGYFPSAQQNLGVATRHMRGVVRELKRELAAWSARDVVALASAIIDQNTLEGRQAAYEILAGHRAARESLKARDVIRLGRGIDNWASVDGFGCTLAGVAWREGRIGDAEIARWARSRDRWWRRAALVATVPLNAVSKGGSGEVGRTLALCEMLAEDPDDMVAKALSWALRELIRWDRQAVQDFLKRREAVLARRVTREVRHKLATGRKSGR